MTIYEQVAGGLAPVGPGAVVGTALAVVLLIGGPLVGVIVVWGTRGRRR